MRIKRRKTPKSAERRSAIITRTTADKTLNRQIAGGGTLSARVDLRKGVLMFFLTFLTLSSNSKGYNRRRVSGDYRRLSAVLMGWWI